MIKGADSLIARFKTLSNELQEDIKDAVEETTIDIQREAIRKAPAAGDRLLISSSSIGNHRQNSQKNNTGINQYIFAAFDVEDKGYSGQVYVDQRASDIAAYIEFGTGASAGGYVPTLPIEWQQIARTYYKTGRGTLIKQPYLLPSFFEQSPKLIKRIVEILKKAKV